jgi:uncharacterized protein YigE (DUF2233 family)
MNGGIFEPTGVPSGLLIQDGKQMRPLNRDDGDGNFFLKPNGVFLTTGDSAAVIDSADFPPEGAKIRYAVQSGPLLLHRGKPHPAFRPASESRLHRNGIGITAEGEVKFAMTEIDSPRFPNLYEFAIFFRELGCTDALFLDGDLCQMQSGAELGRPSNNFGSVIAIVAP